MKYDVLVEYRRETTNMFVVSDNTFSTGTKLLQSQYYTAIRGYYRLSHK